MRTPVASAESLGSIEDRSWVSTLTELTKARLSALVLLTTYVGYAMGVTRPVGDAGPLWATLLGAGALAAGAAALNQVLERRHDRLMERTQDRPLVTGAISARLATVIGGAFSLLGALALWFWVSTETLALGLSTWVSYLFIYTPLKRRTTLNTLVGAIPGAIPPMIGWAAGSGAMGAGGWALFAILFLWQVPHFMAIAWLYRDDYEKGGFRMLPLEDPHGHRTAAQALFFTALLIEASLAPVFLGVNGLFYGAGALGVGIYFLRAAMRFSKARDRASARGLFVASIIYLPILLGLMMTDKF